MSDCPCGSGKTFEACCGPYLAGDLAAPTAEALMRSRYTAYVRGNLDYLEQTLDPQSRHDYDREGAERWSRTAVWQGLTVHDAVERGDEAEVEFTARFEMEGMAQEHRECSRFRRRDSAWYFIDGKVRGPAPVTRSSPKVGRNDPCPCGSGKKFKKCCG